MKEQPEHKDSLDKLLDSIIGKDRQEIDQKVAWENIQHRVFYGNRQGYFSQKGPRAARFTVAASIAGVMLVLGGILAYFLVYKALQPEELTTVTYPADAIVLTLPDGEQINLSDVEAAAKVKEAKLAVAINKKGLVYTGGSGEHRLRVPEGQQYKVTLTDGSEVWINGGSAIRYQVGFPERDRGVQLKGEAFFKVRKKPEKPFIVHTRKMEIKVLGTSFNVQAYEEDAEAVATLVEGKVKALQNAREQELQPGQQVVARENIAMEVHNVDTEIFTAWIDGKLRFENKTMEALLLQLERWYGLEIVCGDTALLRQRFTGQFSEESIEQVLDYLKVIEEFNYTVNKNEDGKKQILIRP
ncbi:FecR domain-containing protein [Rapidithrix thailandica]|uniref:FecR domain-containing protein n=1 Tax=Rapidithrix thailandica TaxID=413964 RepID=A0AAW9S2A1_9BACT